MNARPRISGRAEQPEEVRRDLAHPQLFRKGPAGVVHDPGSVRRDVLHDSNPAAGSAGIWRARPPAAGPLRRRVHEDDQPIRIGERHRLQQDRIDDRENGGICADPQRQRGDGGQGEGRALREHPQGMLQVSEKGFKHEGLDGGYGVFVEGGVVVFRVCRCLSAIAATSARSFFAS